MPIWFVTINYLAKRGLVQLKYIVRANDEEHARRNLLSYLESRDLYDPLIPLLKQKSKGVITNVAPIKCGDYPYVMDLQADN
jgi:hypothetical protein